MIFMMNYADGKMTVINLKAFRQGRFPKSWTSSEEIHQQKSKDESPVSKTLKTAKDAFPQANETIDLPKADVIKIHFEDGWIALRPSGTELRSNSMFRHPSHQ